MKTLHASISLTENHRNTETEVKICFTYAEVSIIIYPGPVQCTYQDFFVKIKTTVSRLHPWKCIAFKCHRNRGNHYDVRDSILA